MPLRAELAGHCAVGRSWARGRALAAVEARTNVEVDQERVPAGCVSVDLAELSDTLRGTASHPLLLGILVSLPTGASHLVPNSRVRRRRRRRHAAYKFLQPSYDLALTVQRHGDVSVCVARA